MLILFGFQGCGKSYAGRLISEKLNWDWIDTDDLIEKNEGLTPREIIQSKGELYFRTKEREVIQSLTYADNTIVSLGGGAILYNIDKLISLGQLVYLDVEKDVLRSRWKKDPALFEKLYDERKVLYENINAIRVKTVWEVIHLVHSLK